MCQKRRQILDINPCVWDLERLKTVCAGQRWRPRHREQSVDTVGEGATNRDDSMETYSLPYAKEAASGGLPCDTAQPSAL